MQNITFLKVRIFVILMLSLFVVGSASAQETFYTYPTGAFSPVENIIAISDGGTVRFYDNWFQPVDELAVLDSPASVERHITNMRWSPDGKKLIFSIYDIQTENVTTGILLEMWEYSSHTWQKKFTLRDLMVTDIAWSPDGQLFLVSDVNVRGYPTTIHMYDANTGDAKISWRGDDPRIFQLAWHPDGNQVASSGRDLILWDISVNPPEETILMDNSASLGLSYSPDGSKIAASQDSTTEISIYDTNSYTLLGMIDDEAIELMYFFWHSDIIIGAGLFNDIKLWDAATGESILTISDKIGSRGDMITFNPNMSQLLLISHETGIHTRDTQTGEIIATLADGLLDTNCEGDETSC